MLGGKYQIRIESIRECQTGLNYKQYCNSLYYFDCMVSGNMMKSELDDAGNQCRKKILKELIAANRRSDPRDYIDECFAAFCEHKHQLVINLFQLDQNFRGLKDLIIDENNLIRGDLWTLFRNIKKMKIYTTKHNGKKSVRFDVLEFLKSVPMDIDGLTVIVKATRYQWKQQMESWLLMQYKVLNTTELVSFPFELDMIQTRDDQNLIEDCLIIRL